MMEMTTSESRDDRITDGLPLCSTWLKSAISVFDYGTGDLNFTNEKWTPPVSLSTAQMKEAATFAEKLGPMMRQAPLNHVREWLASLGVLAASQMSATDARLKMSALTEALRDYPIGVFTRENMLEIARKCKWLPSFQELAEVLDRKAAELGAMHKRATILAAITLKKQEEEYVKPTEQEKINVSAMIDDFVKSHKVP